jgi:broad specificity phosphatase PhoE
MKLYLIRHGVSCTNILRAVQGNHSLDADRYIDPELTEEGRQIAKRLRPFLLKKLKGKYVVGASKLLRAQQTAYLLLKPSKLLIVPHISELMRESLECTPMSKELQARTVIERTGDRGLPPIRDYTYFEDDTVRPEQEQVQAFLHWLAVQGPMITKGNKALVLVSHSLFIDEFIRETLGTESGGILNYEMVQCDIDIKDKVATVKSCKRVPYVPRKKLQWRTRKHIENNRCRIPVRRHKTYKNGS